jgi:hypothetical protein
VFWVVAIVPPPARRWQTVDCVVGGISYKRGTQSVEERKPIPLEPKLVAEVSADHVENGRFRHGSASSVGVTTRNHAPARWIR